MSKQRKESEAVGYERGIREVNHTISMGETTAPSLKIQSLNASHGDHLKTQSTGASTKIANSKSGMKR